LKPNLKLFKELVMVKGLAQLYENLNASKGNNISWGLFYPLKTKERRRIMKRLTILIIIAGLGLLFVPAAVLGAPEGPPNGLNVNIVNPLPVPVSGDVNATVSGDVNAAVTGEVNANQSGAWGVDVINDENNPVPVYDIQTQGPDPLWALGVDAESSSMPVYNRTVNLDFHFDAYGSVPPSDTVPYGKVAVIEHFSCYLKGSGATFLPIVTILSSAGGTVESWHHFCLNPIESDYYRANINSPVKMYIRGGRNLKVQFAASGPSDMECSVTGYFTESSE
jgi:hypothetical protein